VFDTETGFMRGKDQNGKFREPFNPADWSRDFVEGNSWHWTWSVFHDPKGLIELMGGKEAFNAKLDAVFAAPLAYKKDMIHEEREMRVMNMGQYAHGNQPIQHMIYLYGYAGQPWKGQYWVREVMDKLYDATPNGYCGDEDNGQTSAWYVFSAMGFYPVCPGANQYVLGSPLFQQVTLRLENGKQVVISAKNNNERTRYIKTLLLGGRPYTKNYVAYDDLLKGARLDFEMSAEPNKQRGVNEDDFPYSFSNEFQGSKK
jgi:predicted alpha-1,2-mannosidase